MTGFRRYPEYRDSGVNQEREDAGPFKGLAGSLPVDPGRLQDRGGDPMAEEPCDQRPQSSGQGAEAAPNRELREKARVDAAEAARWTAARETALLLPTNATA